MQVIDALFSDDISGEVRKAAFAFLAIGGLAFVMSVLEMGLFIWSGEHSTHAASHAVAMK